MDEPKKLDPSCTMIPGLTRGEPKEAILDPSPHWKKEPTEPGWYWVKRCVGRFIDIVHVTPSGGELLAWIGNSAHTIEEIDGTWQGPLTPKE